MPGAVVVYLCYPDVVVVVLWSVVLVCGMDERVHFYADSEDIEAWYVEYAQLLQ